MQRVARRLEREAEIRVLTDVQYHLMRGARRRARHRARPAGLDRAVQMAARHPLDLGVAPYHARERVLALQTDAVHIGDARLERGVMHEDQRRLRARLAEPR